MALLQVFGAKPPPAMAEQPILDTVPPTFADALTAMGKADQHSHRLNPLTGPGMWSFDANLLKIIKIAESKTLTLRVDARNVFNHPTPADPNLNINSGTFGEINSKIGSRKLQGQIHLQF